MIDSTNMRASFSFTSAQSEVRAHTSDRAIFRTASLSEDTRGALCVKGDLNRPVVLLPHVLTRDAELIRMVSQSKPSVAPLAKALTEDPVLARIIGQVPTTLETECRYCLAHMGEPITVRILARSVWGIGERALELRHRREHFPPPSVVIALLRLLRAIHLMAFEGESLERAALRFGYGSAWSLRRVLRRYLKLGRIRPRDREAFVVAIATFLAIVTPRSGTQMLEPSVRIQPRPSLSIEPAERYSMGTQHIP
jgi:hypothetical protein